jgi:hypothetical protein
MKNLIVIYVFFLAYLSCYAQDPQLFENTWYLNNLVIEGNNNPAPSNSELNGIQLIFSEMPTVNLITYACDILDGELAFDQINPMFSFIQYGIVFFGNCIFQPNIDYSNLYFSFFENEINFPFSYEVTMANGIRFLSITNEAGDQAFYADEGLSIKDQNAVKLGVSPNPFTDKLNISLDQGEIVEIQVYNLLGKEVFQQKGNSQEVYVEDLSSGVYFLRVFTDRGSRTKKIIKMN